MKRVFQGKGEIVLEKMLKDDSVLVGWGVREFIKLLGKLQEKGYNPLERDFEIVLERKIMGSGHETREERFIVCYLIKAERKDKKDFWFVDEEEPEVDIYLKGNENKKIRLIW